MDIINTAVLCLGYAALALILLRLGHHYLGSEDEPLEPEFDTKFTLPFIRKELQALIDLNRHMTPFEVNYYDALCEMELEREIKEEI